LKKDLCICREGKGGKGRRKGFKDGTAENSGHFDGRGSKGGKENPVPPPDNSGRKASRLRNKWESKRSEGSEPPHLYGLFVVGGFRKNLSTRGWDKERWNRAENKIIKPEGAQKTHCFGRGKIARKKGGKKVSKSTGPWGQPPERESWS